MGAALIINRDEITAMEAAHEASPLTMDYGNVTGSASAATRELLAQYGRFFAGEPAALSIDIRRENLVEDFRHRADRCPTVWTPEAMAEAVFGLLVCAKGNAIAAKLKAA